MFLVAKHLYFAAKNFPVKRFFHGKYFSVKKVFFWEKKVAVLESGDFFGESVLVSDSKRTATVTALTDLTCFVLLKPSLSTLNQNALFKENMKVVFARRKMQLKKA